MRILPLLLLAAAIARGTSTGSVAPGLVWIEGGTFKHPRSNYYERSASAHPYVGRLVAVAGFHLGRHEVTQKEWQAVMETNPSKFKGDDLPVETVSWYDCIEYCNRRSLKEGFTPYYTIDRGRQDATNTTEMDGLKWRVTINAGANGYRLPTEMEWEYAAGGGQMSKGYTYSGGNDLDGLAWFWQNAGDRKLQGPWNWSRIEQNNSTTKPVGLKRPNELGLHDMSGNVREWCWNWYAETASVGAGPDQGSGGRVWRGGGWMGGEFCCEPTFRAGFEASGKGPDQGFRVCRD